MRLICPRCNAEYEIDDQLIPANGREVECSSCENVWFQPGRLRMPEPLSRLSLIAGAGAQGEAEPDQQADMDGLQAGMATDVTPDAPSSVLDRQSARRDPPEDVMAILREEAAHFRASRPDIGTEADPDMTGDPDEATITATPYQDTSLPDDASPDLVAKQEALSDMAPQVEQHETQADRRPPAAEGPEQADIPTDSEHLPVGQEVFAISESGPESQDGPPLETTYAAPASAITATQAAPQQGSWRGFGKGFLIGIVIAGIGLGLYLAAPHAGDGWLGDVLREWRATGDQFHHKVQGWLGRLP